MPPMRRKNKGNGGRENPSNSVSNRGKSFETPKAARTVHGTPNKRNPPSSNKGQKLVQWDKDYSKMLDQIKNMNIDELRVVELGGGQQHQKERRQKPHDHFYSPQRNSLRWQQQAKT